MTDTVKLIIEIPEELYENKKRYLTNMDAYMICKAVQNGTPLDSNSERAETQAYFAGEAYGWEQGRKALIEDVKAEIRAVQDKYSHPLEIERAIEILDNIGNAENKDPNDMTRMFEGVTEIPKDAFKGWYTEKTLEQTRAESEEV